MSVTKSVDRFLCPEEGCIVHFPREWRMMELDDIAQFCQCCIDSGGMDRVGVWDGIVPPRYLILFDVWSDPVPDVSDFIHRFLRASVLPH